MGQNTSRLAPMALLAFGLPKRRPIGQEVMARVVATGGGGTWTFGTLAAQKRAFDGPLGSGNGASPGGARMFELLKKGSGGQFLIVGWARRHKAL
jgi:hypothetical protein